MDTGNQGRKCFVKPASDTRISERVMETLERDVTESRVGSGIYTVMHSMTVDGIKVVNPKQVYAKPMFSFKDEFDDEGDPADTGGLAYYYKADMEVSEKHWLSCKIVTDIGSYCVICGERAD